MRETRAEARLSFPEKDVAMDVSGDYVGECDEGQDLQQLSWHRMGEAITLGGCASGSPRGWMPQRWKGPRGKGLQGRGESELRTFASAHGGKVLDGEGGGNEGGEFCGDSSVSRDIEGSGNSVRRGGMEECSACAQSSLIAEELQR